MKTRVTDTSLDAHREVKASGRVQVVQGKITAFMAKWRGPLTRQDLSFYLDEPINVICGRVHEMVEAGQLIVTGDTRKDRNGEKCNKRDLLMLPAAQYELFARSDRSGAIQEART